MLLQALRFHFPSRCKTYVDKEDLWFLIQCKDVYYFQTAFVRKPISFPITFLPKCVKLGQKFLNTFLNKVEATLPHTLPLLPLHQSDINKEPGPSDH